jgi:hypothetical protein
MIANQNSATNRIMVVPISADTAPHITATLGIYFANTQQPKEENPPPAS